MAKGGLSYYIAVFPQVFCSDICAITFSYGILAIISLQRPTIRLRAEWRKVVYFSTPRMSLHMRDIRVANAMQNAPEARITHVAPGVRNALLSMGYFWSVL
jgi:hypothetical protein